MEMGDTAELLRRAAAGEPVQPLVYERIRPRLVTWVHARLSPQLRSKLEPEDVVQEILLALHRGPFEYRDERAFFSWVYRVAENRIRDLADYHGAQKRQMRPAPPPSVTSPSSGARRSELTERLHDAVSRLRDDYRRVILLRRIEERDTEEVARLLERSPGAVRVLYCRALKALRREIDDLGETPPAGRRSEGQE